MSQTWVKCIEMTRPGLHSTVYQKSP